jgi:predicted dehydrogenase/threonine dehydrogenase-like Zn-dependent dehydrogenase
VKQVVQHVSSHGLELIDVPEPACKAGGIVVGNVATLISAGTEKMVIDFANKSLLGKAQERPDLVKKVMDKAKREGLGAMLRSVQAGLQQSIALGYSCAGVVVEVGRGAEEFAVGDRVACAGMGYASHAEVVYVPKNLSVAIPANVSFEDASYVTLGAIALHGVRTAEVVLGEWVAVIGLGLLGQLTVQLLKASGCRVIGIDLDPAKVALAIKLGADAAVARSDDVVGVVMQATGGIGADCVIIAAAADSNDPIELSAEVSRDRGRVCMVGAVKMDIPRKPFYMKELDLRLSRSYGPGRYDPTYEEGGNDYPIGYVRWTERRNMEEFLRLVSVGLVTPSALTTHRFPIGNAMDAYEIVTGKVKTPFSGVILTYDYESRPRIQPRTVVLAERPSRVGAVGVGFIGAGNFATAVLLPRFSKRKDAALTGIATATGAKAAAAGKRFGFGYATTDTRKLLDDPAVTLVAIATRHGSHAKFASDAMRAGKAVFVEKPLAIDEKGLEQVMEAQRATGQPICVGFNRRFSSLSIAARDAFVDDTRLAIDYRVNAGRIPPESWVHDPEDGGGRIVGEVCHFVDLLQFLTDDVPTEVFAYGIGGADGKLHDTVHATIKFAKGSVGNIGYYATGDSAVAKERIEIFGGGKVVTLDDFRELRIAASGKVTKKKLLSQDKGFDREVELLLDMARGNVMPIAFDSLVLTTRTTFAIEESLRTGQPVAITAE